jgi:hypothetical protein
MMKPPLAGGTPAMTELRLLPPPAGGRTRLAGVV